MTEQQSAWEPRIRLDLKIVSTAAFNTALEDFDAWRAKTAPPELDLTNGWKTITPQIAEAMLMRNPLKGNRKPTLPTVRYYANQMMRGDWKKTGQPVIFDTNGELRDAGHRLWSSYLSGASFDSYLVGDVPADETLFAFIDNGKARSPADALATAGLDGQAKLLAPVVIIAQHYDGHAYTASNKKKLDRMGPIEFIRYVNEHENVRTAARLMAGEHKSALTLIGHRDVAIFAAFQILDLYDEFTLDQFMGELESIDDDKPEGSPIAAVQKVLETEQTAREPMQKHQVLGHIIKAFNAWRLGEQVKKISLRVNETFPRFLDPKLSQQAAA